jgi:hypothetical protein
VARLHLDSEEHAGRFFEMYSDALEKKYGGHVHAPRSSNFLSFDSPEGGVFWRCVGAECISVEGTNRAVFDGINGLIGWPSAPPASKSSVARGRSLMNAAAFAER